MIAAADFAAIEETPRVARRRVTLNTLIKGAGPCAQHLADRTRSCSDRRPSPVGRLNCRGVEALVGPWSTIRLCPCGGPDRTASDWLQTCHERNLELATAPVRARSRTSSGGLAYPATAVIDSLCVFQNYCWDDAVLRWDPSG